ncbi:MAG: tellurite resistance TerB family protein [Gammaproteobacteria bacterium]|nr:tellurite resistance TerB family protein [Gammaproteobacteria bacterium]
MDFEGLLNQLVSSGEKLTRQSGVASNQGGMSDIVKGALGGAVGGSLLTLLVGSKKGRKLGKKAARYGGTAALGALAYKVFNDWQSQQTSHSPPQSGSGISGQQAVIASQSQQHSRVVLKAIIAAAKSDGHVNDEERDRIDQAVQAMGASADVRTFVHDEMQKPLDPTDVARGVTSMEEAAEIYLASVIMVDEQNFMERAYLNELANKLNLQPDLKNRLEQQVS